MKFERECMILESDKSSQSSNLLYPYPLHVKYLISQSFNIQNNKLSIVIDSISNT